MSAEDRRTMIIAATEPLLREHGRAVSTRQIATAAGVAEGTIFRVFDSKESLIDAVLERAFSSEVTREKLAGIDSNASLRTRLIAAADILQQRMLEAFTLIHALGPPNEPKEEDRRSMRNRMLAEAELLNQALIELIGSDDNQVIVDAATTAHLLRAMIFALSHPIATRVQGFPVHSAPAVAVVDLLLYGINTDGPPDDRSDLVAALLDAATTNEDSCIHP